MMKLNVVNGRNQKPAQREARGACAAESRYGAHGGESIYNRRMRARAPVSSRKFERRKIVQQACVGYSNHFGE